MVLILLFPQITGTIGSTLQQVLGDKIRIARYLQN